MPFDGFSHPGNLRLTRAAVLPAPRLSTPQRYPRIAPRNPRVQDPPWAIVYPCRQRRSGIPLESAAHIRRGVGRGQPSVAALEPAAIQRDKHFEVHVEQRVDTQLASCNALSEHLRELVVLGRGDLVAVTELPVRHPSQLGADTHR